jgi:hypothetical protein
MSSAKWQGLNQADAFQTKSVQVAYETVERWAPTTKAINGMKNWKISRQ